MLIKKVVPIKIIRGVFAVWMVLKKATHPILENNHPNKTVETSTRLIAKRRERIEVLLDMIFRKVPIKHHSHIDSKGRQHVHPGFY